MNIELTEVFVAVHDINDDGGEIFHSLVVTIITSSAKHIISDSSTSDTDIQHSGIDIQHIDFID